MTQPSDKSSNSEITINTAMCYGKSLFLSNNIKIRESRYLYKPTFGQHIDDHRELDPQAVDGNPGAHGEQSRQPVGHRRAAPPAAARHGAVLSVCVRVRRRQRVLHTPWRRLTCTSTEAAGRTVPAPLTLPSRTART